MDQAAVMRERILDAAVECLLRGGFRSARLHSAIARVAGLSRPTVYKYVGDQEAIIGGVIQRELAAFLDELEPLLDQDVPVGEQLENMLVFAVCRAREHTLLDAAMREIPQRLLPWFTTHAAILLGQVEPVLTPRIRRYIDNGQLPELDPRLLADALCRIVLSLVFTSGLLDLTDQTEMRVYLRTVAATLCALPLPAHG
jgi:AcrR family transcriptional regulator